MRKLSDAFLQALQTGFLAKLRQAVCEDYDLDFQIRNNYVNIYYKGNSLLKLDQVSSQRYRVSIHPKFTSDMNIADLVDEQTTIKFIQQIPEIKRNILKHGKSSLETEYEQMIIRANNYEPRNNSEYFILDRQYTAGKSGRFDLTGIYWSSQPRRAGQTVPLCLMEVKFALNQDIQNVNEQLERYYLSIRANAAEMAEEAEIVLRQKVALELFKQPANRLEAMKTLTVARDIEQFQFILIMVDYNPNSTLFQLDKIAQLPFASQVRIFFSGFAMWKTNLTPPPDALRPTSR
jgi:hypothetical protein